MDGYQKMVIIVWLVFALFGASVNIQIADARTELATQNPGFISIDCGADEDYLDETTGLYYKSDKDFVSTGENANTLPQFNYGDDNFNRDLNYRNDNVDQLYRSLRYFPEGKKNCYTLKPDQGNNYLIRAFFSYGNYDGKNQTPKFNLYLGVHHWATIEFDGVDDFFFLATYHYSSSDLISVCLINKGFGIPLISALELRPVDNSTYYRTDSGIAKINQIYDAGYPNDKEVRYKDDIYDRIWRGFMPDDWVLVKATHRHSLDFHGTEDSFKVPSEVLRTAVQPLDNLTSLTFSGDYSYMSSYFNVYFYFAEIRRIPAGLKREFTITLNGVLYGPYTLQYLKPLTVPCERARLRDRFIRFSINSTVDSDLPPILNGFEIIADQIDFNNDSATSPADVGAIMAINQIYKIDRPDWQGDPCMPRDFLWTGLNCTTYDNTPRITSLNLGSSALSGKIASKFSELQELESLNLSNNELTGRVPEFLAELPKLVSLNLAGNKLTGPLPHSLIEKSRNGTLNLSFHNQKPNPCLTGFCEKKKRNFIIPVVSITSLVVGLLVLVILAMRWIKKRRGGNCLDVQLAIFFALEGVGPESPSLPKSNAQSVLKLEGRSFTYSEIVGMTTNFRSIIGVGGFGKVYLGNLSDGTRVAVKLLSQSSKQGLKEFLSEDHILIKIHHRNLVSLIGHCVEHGNIALVYEYMENGNLKQHLSEKSKNVLTWRQRLQIAVDAAQGLDYLHNGCKPPIIHRDLKTSNILLNEHFVAKISDFGLSRVFAADKDTHVTTNPCGTPGYVDPELYVTGTLNKKNDVYSFGIILFELITGQPAVIRGEECNIHIVQWVSPMIESGDIQSIVDQRLKGDFNINSAWKALEIAMSCVAQILIHRPDMGHVLAELKECLDMDMPSGKTERTSGRITESNIEF